MDSKAAPGAPGFTSVNKLALVIGAHPDDPEFGAGGTIALWGQQGWQFHYLIVTDGSKGTSDPRQDGQQLVQRRQDEQRAAARQLGVQEVRFLHFHDGEVEASQLLLSQLVRELRRLRPRAVFTHNPEALEYRKPGGRPHIAHRDHRAVGHSVLDAVYPAARDPHYFPEHGREGLLPHKVRDVYLWGSGQADLRVDVRATFGLKLEAIRCHGSQIPADHPRLLKAERRWQEGRAFYEYFRHVRVSL